MARDNERIFITPGEAVAEIRAYLELEEVKEEPILDPIRTVLDRTSEGGSSVTLRGLKAGIMEALNRNDNGIESARLWSWLRRGGDTIPMAAVDTALIEMERDGLAHTFQGGPLTVWRKGKAPEPPKGKK